VTHYELDERYEESPEQEVHLSFLSSFSYSEALANIHGRQKGAWRWRRSCR
jgi:hypothetical protein